MTVWLSVLLSLVAALSAGFGVAMTETSKLPNSLFEVLEKQFPKTKDNSKGISKGLKELLEYLGKLGTDLSSQLESKIKKLKGESD